MGERYTRCNRQLSHTILEGTAKNGSRLSRLLFCKRRPFVTVFSQRISASQEGKAHTYYIYIYIYICMYSSETMYLLTRLSRSLLDEGWWVEAGLDNVCRACHYLHNSSRLLWQLICSGQRAAYKTNRSVKTNALDLVVKAPARFHRPTNCCRRKPGERHARRAENVCNLSLNTTALSYS